MFKVLIALLLAIPSNHLVQSSRRPSLACVTCVAPCVGASVASMISGEMVFVPQECLGFCTRLSLCDGGESFDPSHW